MPDFRHGARAAVLAGAVLALGFAGATAKGAPGTAEAPGKEDVATWGNTPSQQHGGSSLHLPAARENIELVGKVEVKGRFGNVLPEQIADVAVYKNYAYLNSWSGNATTVAQGNCERGGTYIVDISNPKVPVETGFVPAPVGSYHGEGAHVITMPDGPLKGRDILGVNNEPCNNGPGGFDLVDVTDPRNPVILTAAFGDTGPEDATETGVDELTGTEVANSSHSIFMWSFNGKSYAVIVDNAESNDIDIFDITDPRAPKPVIGFGLHDPNDPDPEFSLFPESTTDNLYLHHDSVVKIINGKPIMLTSYWDSGYQTFDISDPANPVHIGDTSFAGSDPLTGLEPQEGNAHYGEFSHDNKYILAADEDFSAYRPGSFRIASGPDAGEYDASAPSGSTGVVVLPDKKLNGPVVYGGFGCPAGSGDTPTQPAHPIPLRSDYTDAELGLDRGEEAILVLSRGPYNHPDYPGSGPDVPPGPNAFGGCFPGEKVGYAQDAGWDAVILVNRHHGSADDDSATCGSGGYPADTVIPSLCTTHTAFHLMFGDEPNYDPDYTPNEEPEFGDIGEHVESEALFDGWGYARLYENGAGTMRELGAYAIEEALDSRFAFGFGDLSIHEWATDPTEYLAYAAYYAGGVRVASFGPGGIKEEGKFIDVGGSNFWGIEQFTTSSGERLMAASDRDYGLYILKYTGPGAAQPPSCEDRNVTAQAGQPINIPLICTDPNGNPLTLTIASQPTNGTLAPVNGNAVTYTPRAGFRGDDVFTYTAFDGAATSRPATVRIRVLDVVLPGTCGFSLLGTSAGDTLNGTVNADTILGGPGNDRISGQQGDDCLLGEDGDDSIDAGPGDDRLEGGNGKDRMFGDAGKDNMRGNAGVDHMRGSSGNDVLRGHAGNDYLSGGSNNDTVVGGSGRDSIIGDAGNDILRGDSGNDSITDAKGRNRVSGGSGNDRIRVVNGSRDRVVCGKGRDVVRADRSDRVGRSCERVLRTRTTRR